jgi:hypothetical protein
MSEIEVEELYTGFYDPFLSFPYLVILILVALPLAAIAGFHLGKVEFRRRGYDRVPPKQVPGGTSLGAMLALLGLLLGFAFSSALGWREARQSALVEEAKAISTAFLTADLLEDPGRTDLQTRLLSYTQTRLATASDTRSRQAWNAFLARTMEAQAEIWPATLRALDQETSDPIRTAVAGSVTDMLDAHTQRIAAAAEQIPPPAKGMILLVAVVGILIVGNRSALQGRPLTWRTFVFAGVLSIVMIVIFDLDLGLEGTMRVNPDTMRATIHEMETALAARHQ